MPNIWYDKGAEHFAAADVNWGVGTGGHVIKAYAIDVSDYTFSQAHEFLSDVPSLARVSVSPAFTGKTLTGGVLDADDIVFPSVVGDPVGALIIVKSTGTDSTSVLLHYIDGVTGIPFTPSGAHEQITWSDGPSKIAVL